MKNLIVSIFLLTSAITQAQEIVGRWKIVSIDNGEIYYNIKKDSLVISPEFKEDNLNEGRRSQLKTMAKMTYGETQFSFDSEGNYNWMFMPSMEIVGKYILDEKKRTITLNGTNSLGETVSDEFPYSIKNAQLEILVNFSEPPGKYVLEKK